MTTQADTQDTGVTGTSTDSSASQQPSTAAPNIDNFVAAIVHQEGAKPELHNPGNIKDMGTGKIKQFNSDEEGRAALESQVQGMVNGSPHYPVGTTLRQAGMTYSGGDPNWSKNVAQKLGVDEDTPLSNLGPKSKPLFDMSKAVSADTPTAHPSKPLFDMSKAVPANTSTAAEPMKQEAGTVTGEQAGKTWQSISNFFFAPEVSAHAIKHAGLAASATAQAMKPTDLTPEAAERSLQWDKDAPSPTFRLPFVLVPNQEAKPGDSFWTRAQKVAGIRTAGSELSKQEGEQYDVNALATGIYNSAANELAGWTSKAALATFGGAAIIKAVAETGETLKSLSTLAEAAKPTQEALNTAESISGVRAGESIRAVQQVTNMEDALEKVRVAREAGAASDADVIAAEERLSAATANASKTGTAAQEAVAARNAARLASDKISAQIADLRQFMDNIPHKAAARIVQNLPESVLNPTMKAAQVAQKTSGLLFTGQGVYGAVTPQGKDEPYADYLDRVLHSLGQTAMGAGEVGETALQSYARAKDTMGMLGEMYRNNRDNAEVWKNTKSQIDAKQKFMQAIKPAPGKSAYDDNDYWAVRPFIENSHAQEDITNTRGVYDALESQRQGIHNQVQTQVKKYANEPLELGKNTDGTAQTVRQKIVHALAEDEGTTAGFTDKALSALDKYNIDNLSLGEADKLRTQLNNVVRERLAKSDWDVARLRATDPEFAGAQELLDVLREGERDTLVKNGVSGADEMYRLESSFIKMRNAAARQLNNDIVTRRGTGEQSVVKKAGATAAGVAVGATTGALGGMVTGIPGAPEILGAAGGWAGKKIGEAIAKPNQTVEQLIQQAMKPTGAPKSNVGLDLTNAKEAGAENPPEHPWQNSDVHNMLANHYPEVHGVDDPKWPVDKLMRRFESDITLSNENHVPLTSDESKIRIEIGKQKIADINDAKKAAEKEAEAQADAKTKAEQASAKETAAILKAQEDAQTKAKEDAAAKKAAKETAADEKKRPIATPTQVEAAEKEAREKTAKKDEEEEGEEPNPLITPERQTPLVHPYEVSIRNPEGEEIPVEPIEALSHDQALKAATKKYPNARELSIGQRLPRTPGEYSTEGVPVRKMEAGDTQERAVRTMRHENAHFLIGHGNGIEAADGIISKTHRDSPGDIRAGVSWDPQSVLRPDGSPHPEKLDGAIEMIMAGIAQDELDGVHRASNNNNWGRNDDRGLAQELLRRAGFSPEEASAKADAAIDAAKKKLTHPVTSGMIDENSPVRERGLSTQYHASQERLDLMAKEHDRRMAEHEKQNAGTTGGAEGINAPRAGQENARGNVQVEPGRQGEVPGGGEQALRPAAEVTAAKAAPARGNVVLERMAKAYGTTDDASGVRNGASFIGPDGKFIHLPGGAHHPDAIEFHGGPKAEGETRPAFLEESGAVRVRHNPSSREGELLQVSVPPQGVNPAQVEAIKKAVGQGLGNSGTLYLERADVTPETKDQLTAKKEFVHPNDVDGMLRNIQAHPDTKGVPNDSILGRKLTTNMNHEPMAGYMAGLHGEAPNAATDAQIAAHEANGGSTFTPEGENLAGQDKYAVGAYPTRTVQVDKLTPNVLNKFKADNADVLSKGGHTVGTWRGPQTGKTVLDVSRLHDSREAAIAAGKAANQKSVYHLGGEGKIQTGGTGEGPLVTPDKAPEEEGFAFGHNAEGTPDQQTGLISARVPTGKNATENPMTQDLTIGRDAIINAPGKTKGKTLSQRVADKIRDIPGIKIPENIKDPVKIMDRFVDHIKNNLIDIHNRINPETREQNAKWYDSARGIGDRIATQYGSNIKQAIGTIAAMSPQKDWDMNVGLSERLNDIYHTKKDIKMTPEMESKASQLSEPRKPTAEEKAEGVEPPARNAALKKIMDNIRGKSLSELTDPLEKAAWIRLFDEAHNPREYHHIDPGTGQKLGLTQGDNGPAKIAWGSLKQIGNAVSILDDGSRQNISDSLGGSHKVRNFYNNLLDPNNPAGHVTIDTHAVAAGLMRALSGKSREVLDNFGGIGSAATGAKGMYGLYADAYRAAAKELGIQPRQLQSVVWEEVRKMFPSEMKGNDLPHKAAIDKIWQDYQDGKISVDKARQNVVDYAKQAREGMAKGQPPGKISATDLLKALGQKNMFEGAMGALGGNQ